MTPSLEAYVMLSAALFVIGFLGVLLRRNTLVIYMCLELMLVAATLALVAFSRFNGTEDGDVFVCLSEHEGFCIPLLEAMGAGTPIVALDAGAVGETLADAGILLAEARPATVAAAVDRVVRDPHLTEHLVAAGRRRLGDFAATTTRQRFVEVLGRVAGDVRVVA